MGGGLGEALHRFRVRNGLRRLPLQVVYWESRRLNLDGPMFTTPRLPVIIVTTGPGTGLLRAQGADEKGITIAVACGEIIDSIGLTRLHKGLFDEFGVRHLDCEGGAVILESLHRAGILDEMFVTAMDIHVEPDERMGVKRIFEFEAEAARLIRIRRNHQERGHVGGVGSAAAAEMAPL